MNLEEDKKEKVYEEALEILQKGEDKSQAIVDVLQLVNEANNTKLIAELKEQAEQVAVDEDFAKSLKLRKLSKDEKQFYSALKDSKQSITAEQLDIIPTTIIDRTLDDLHLETDILKLVTFTPASVKKWLVAEHTGVAAWGDLLGPIANEITATISSLNIEVGKLTAYFILPKAIKDLALEFVDKYFRALLRQILRNGIVKGYLTSDGNNSPIGIYKQINSSTDGVHNDKPLQVLTNFSPKALAPVKKTLSNNGKRNIGKFYLICNPNDEADYVAPALYDREGNLRASYKNIEVIPEFTNPIGKAAITLEGKYIMGLTNMGFTQYDQTMAMDDADVLIGKAYGNGRAIDDNCAFVFDVTQLEEYIPTVRTVTDEIAEA